MADPRLQGCYPIRGLYQALAVAAMCLQEQAATRPLMGDVVTALTYLASQSYDPNSPAPQSRGGSSTPRQRDARRNISDVDILEDPGRRSHLDSPSSHKNSPDFQRVEMGSGSDRRWGTDEQEGSDSSPASTGRARERLRNRDLERERRVAAAKVWGENLREKKRTNDDESL